MFQNQSSLLKFLEKHHLYFMNSKDRDYEKSEKEAHMQLSINLFQKRQVGLNE